MSSKTTCNTLSAAAIVAISRGLNTLITKLILQLKRNKKGLTREALSDARSNKKGNFFFFLKPIVRIVSDPPLGLPQIRLGLHYALQAARWHPDGLKLPPKSRELPSARLQSAVFRNPEGNGSRFSSNHNVPVQILMQVIQVLTSSLPLRFHLPDVGEAPTRLLCS